MLQSRLPLFYTSKAHLTTIISNLLIQFQRRNTVLHYLTSNQSLLLFSINSADSFSLFDKTQRLKSNRKLAFVSVVSWLLG